ncbi:MAG: gamma-glutamyltransferase [Holophagales bacterium]|nr:gamma-glutamyltransferase [Holophagales bacterium]
MWSTWLRLPGARLVSPALVVPLLATAVLSTRPSPDPAGCASLAEALVAEPLLSRDGVVVSASEAASRAGARILATGGNAVDAAVATAFALSAADPSESGLGGESWILIQPVDGPAVAVVCPARAPRRANAGLLRRSIAAVGAGHHAAAATPTTVASLAHALARFGTKSLAEVLAPAIEEAERGWVVGWYEASLLRPNARKISFSPVLGPVLFPGACDPDGYPASVAAGARPRLPALARTLRRLAEAGAKDFYTGQIASEIDADMRAHAGFVRRDDLARVPASVLELEPVRALYRDRDIVSIGPPAGGGVIVGALQILGAFPPELVKGPSVDATQLLLDAVRIARADDQVSALASLSGPYRARAPEPARATRRAREIRLGKAWNAEGLRKPGPPSRQSAGTTQVSVVDGKGNAVAITQTLGDDWGSGAAAESLGFPYNSFLSWFELEDPAHVSHLRPNALLPTSVAPTIVLRDGAVEMVLGSAGSSRISSSIVTVLRNVIDGRMSLPDAVAAPRVLWQEDGGERRLIAEASVPVTEAVLAELAVRGYVDQYAVREPGWELVKLGGVNSVGWHAAAGAWEGVGDPRRRGVTAAPERITPRAR